MKSRLFYFFTIIIIISILTSTFILRNKQIKVIPNLNTKSFNAPLSSKYIPTHSDLVFHWKINPRNLPNYIKNYQNNGSKLSINKKISFIIDSSFKLISLDFEKDISNWIGDYGSFALFDSDEKPLDDWIMVLAIKEDVNIEKELESIEGIRIIEGSNTPNNKLSNSIKKIISKKINSSKSIYFANEKDNLLIASSPKLIKLSIEKKNNNILNTKSEYKNIQLKENLKDGFLLLEMSPKKIFNLIGQKDNLFMINEIDNLISSINFEKNKLSLEAILSYNLKTEMSFNSIDSQLIDMKSESNLYKDFIVIDNPMRYLTKNSRHPYQKFIASLIKESATSDFSQILKIILENSKGNLIWINDKNWLVLTSKYDINKTKIIDILKEEGFSSSKFDFKERKLEIWSKIFTDKSESYEIKENIEAIIDENEDSYLWSKNLSSISIFDNKNYLINSLGNEKDSDESNYFNDVLIINLGEEKTKTVLNNFYPYILFKTMLGNNINPPQNIDISVSVPSINYPDFIKVKVNLKTS